MYTYIFKVQKIYFYSFYFPLRLELLFLDNGQSKVPVQPPIIGRDPM